MKLSVNLTKDDVEFIDEYAKARKVDSRSAVVHEAIELLRATQLSDAYAAAWDEWGAEGDTEDNAEPWDSAVRDGLTGTGR
ncbi:MAG: ribbon-helix-helix protein, CopG family [Sciscionella sp.]|nr:ribbon-helix-helix protein, CopG family [Sciscionella sp.]